MSGWLFDAGIEDTPAPRPAPEPTVQGSAHISNCGRYRYELRRWWGDTDKDGWCVFVMLNPSTANADIPDPTMTRCVNYARAWGFGGLIIVNLFAFRATDPNAMCKAENPIGIENDCYIDEALRVGRRVVVAWGDHGRFRFRGREVIARILAMGIEPLCFGLTNLAQPRHPLRQRNDAELIPVTRGMIS